MKKGSWFVGTSRQHDVFLLYHADVNQLKDLALTLDVARKLPKGSGKPKLVFAPTKYLDPHFLSELKITFCQLPYQIYQAVEKQGGTAPYAPGRKTKTVRKPSKTKALSKKK